MNTKKTIIEVIRRHGVACGGDKLSGLIMEIIILTIMTENGEMQQL